MSVLYIFFSRCAYGHNMTQTYNEVYKKFEKILQEIDVNAGKYILLDIVFPTIL